MPENKAVQIAKKIGGFIKKAYTGKFRFLVIAATCIVFLYVMYFAFCFRPTPTYGSKDLYWADARNIAFRVVSAILFIGLFLYGMLQFAQRKLTIHNAAVIIALMGGVFVMIYGLSTPIYDYDGVWNQHDLYYGSTTTRYFMEDKGILDGGGGHFGMIMTVYRYGVIPEIVKLPNGSYDFTFSGVLERYQPKLFYLISGFYMRFNSLFVHCPEGIVSIDGSTAYGLTNQEWALFESLRLLFTMMEWLQIYFIYKIFVHVGLKGKGLLIAFTLAIFSPMWCFFANWANNDGISTFFSIVAIYYAIRYVKEYKWYQIVMIALGVGAAMACKLGGALAALVIAPMLIYVFVKAIIATSKGQRIHTQKMPELVYITLQFTVFALIVFPLGLGFPIYNYIRYGQDIMFFSPVGNEALYIVNESFFERFILFPNSDLFRMIWVYHSNQDAAFGYIQDTSLITAVIKTSLYGEYGFGHSTLQCTMLYVSTLALIFFTMIAVIYRIIMYFINKPNDVNKLRFYVFASIIVVFYGWAVYFVNSFPHTCNQDMRYIAVIIIALSGIVGSTYMSLERNPLLPKVNKVGQYGLMAATALFVAMAFGTYLTISPWFYRV